MAMSLGLFGQPMLLEPDYCNLEIKTKNTTSQLIITGLEINSCLLANGIMKV